MFNLSSLKEGKFHTQHIWKDLKKDKKLFKKITKLMEEKGYKAGQAIYHIVYPKARTTCLHPDCNNPTRYSKGGKYGWGYRYHCSPRCGTTDPKVIEKYKKTCIKNYGVENPSQSLKIKAKMRKTNLKRLGVAYPTQSSKVKAKRVKTYQKNYGVDNPNQSSEIKNKKKNTCMIRYGAPSPLQSEQIKDKIKKIHLTKRGVENPGQSPEVRAKMIATMIKRHGVAYPMQSSMVQSKMIDTYMKNYGVSHHMQDPKSFAKNQISRYGRYITEIGGKEFTYQGYEGHVLKILINQLEIPVRCIETALELQQEVWYPKSNKEKPSRYHIDIRIKYKNKDISIEVKNNYNVGTTDKKLFNEVKAKAKAAFDLGIDYRLWVVDPKKKKVIRINNFHELTQKELYDKVFHS
jgi:hypothetical protein